MPCDQDIINGPNGPVLFCSLASVSVCRLSSSVPLPAGGRAGPAGGRAADTPLRITSSAVKQMTRHLTVDWWQNFKFSL